MYLHPLCLRDSNFNRHSTSFVLTGWYCQTLISPELTVRWTESLGTKWPRYAGRPAIKIIDFQWPLSINRDRQHNGPLEGKLEPSLCSLFGLPQQSRGSLVCLIGRQSGAAVFTELRRDQMAFAKAFVTVSRGGCQSLAPGGELGADDSGRYRQRSPPDQHHR